MQKIVVEKEVLFVKYDGSAESIKAIKSLCELAEKDSSLSYKVSLLGPPNDSLSLETIDKESGGSHTSYLYSNYNLSVVYDPDCKNPIFSCDEDYLKSEYGYSYNPTRDDMLKEMGWQVVCESPLTVEHDDGGSYAVGVAAEYVIDSLIKEYKDERG
jgi:hypothetical protein